MDNLAEILAGDDIDELTAWREHIGAQVRDIQAQLSNPNKIDDAGNRLDGPAFWAWRYKAVRALNHRTDELRAVKGRLHELRLAAHEDLMARGFPVPFVKGMTRAEFVAAAGLAYDQMERARLEREA